MNNNERKAIGKKPRKEVYEPNAAFIGPPLKLIVFLWFLLTHSQEAVVVGSPEKKESLLVRPKAVLLAFYNKIHPFSSSLQTDQTSFMSRVSLHKLT